MFRRGLYLVVAAAGLILGWRAVPTAQRSSADGPEYSGRGELLRPMDYREWMYLTSGLGMTYGPARPAAGRPANFDNVFVNPDSYRQFVASGTWPEKTIFVLEIRSAEEHVSINNGGQTQGGLITMEVSVKDRERFPDTGWGYFEFGLASNPTPAATPLPQSASCYACHRNNTAVEWTFVQFYPTLFEVAKRMGTVKPTYDPAHKP
jgi:Cytochrome P460